MTANLALEYIARRMSELCQTDYYLRFRHLRLQPGEGRTLLAQTDLFILVEPPPDVRVQSIVGMFDVTEDGVCELQYVQRVFIRATTFSYVVIHVRFI